MRRLALFTALALLALSVGPVVPARALECPQSEVINKRDGTSEVICSGQSHQSSPKVAGAGGSAPGRPRVAVPDMVGVLGLGNDPATGLCYRPSGQTIPTAEFNAHANSAYRVWNDVLQRELSRCPAAVAAPTPRR